MAAAFAASILFALPAAASSPTEKLPSVPVPSTEGPQREVNPDSGSAPAAPAPRSPSTGAPSDAAQAEGETDTGGGTGETDAQSAQTDRDCSDFSSQEEAQNFFEQEGGPDADPNRLDADDDGIACEELGAPAGGVDTGGGGLASRPVPSPLPFVTGGSVLALMLAFAGGAFMRRARG